MAKGLFFIALMTAALASPPLWGRSNSSVQVVANARVAERALSREQLRAIFTLKQPFWADGSSVVVVLLPQRHPVHHQFCRQHLRLLPYQLDLAWGGRHFEDREHRPLVVGSEKEMRQTLESTPGAIGYLSGDTQLSANLVRLAF
ncbi:conserved hypothetical protein [Ferrimonas balearica DSM 9799]|uniref:PBP domain-containing protein n=1 Tax=Ferrimonas balearica (strain DSM 9799 / CCM 4581 / KCTC 23876 / PAT) TaxID=550540 RepID=E1SQJ4_FERBD|nr:hypothetical protein [Ferrimonas balearica]ADN74806.1 conserved hypothetical protein [Ferrimonas balearica DSM 9799]